MSETTASVASVADAASHSPARIYIYKRYERFWHWSQALLIIAMLISGFEVHGSYTLLGFEPAVRLHTLAAWLLLTLWAFTIFWQFTTGEWRQYLPTHKKVVAMAMSPLPSIQRSHMREASAPAPLSSLPMVERVPQPVVASSVAAMARPREKRFQMCMRSS